jgi:hypothetical protein
MGVLVIRDEQMRVLRQARLRRFEDEMAAHLTKRFRGTPVVEDINRLRLFVQEGIRLAGEHGIVIQYDVRRFLEFNAEYGADFDTIPWIAKILSDPTRSPSGKMDRLDAYSLFVRS